MVSPGGAHPPRSRRSDRLTGVVRSVVRPGAVVMVVAVLGLAMALPPLAPPTGAAPLSTATASKPRPRVTFSGGPRLVVNVNPNLSGSKSWKFRLDRRSGGTWRKVGVYRTKGRSETRGLKVAEGTYRVHVYARPGYRSATTGRFYYAPSPAAGPNPTPPQTTSPGVTPVQPSWWRPAVGTDWQWQLSGALDSSVDSPVFDIDGQSTSAATVAALHAKGSRAICYFSAGSYEKGRPDAASFPTAALGNALDGWPDERWLDIRNPALLPIMEARIADCAAKGFDAVEPDNVDGYANATGFPLTAADQLAYNRAIADLAHRHGLGVALKNDPEQVTDLEPYFDFAVVEECARYGECSAYTPFVQAGKAVLAVEYQGSLSSFCPTTTALGFSAMLKRLELDAWRSVCP